MLYISDESKEKEMEGKRMGLFMEMMGMMKEGKSGEKSGESKEESDEESGESEEEEGMMEGMKKMMKHLAENAEKGFWDEEKDDEEKKMKKMFMTLKVSTPYTYKSNLLLLNHDNATGTNSRYRYAVPPKM